MRHLILWTQDVGAGASGPREGQGQGPLHVNQEHAQQYTWHIKNVVTMMVRSLEPSTKCTLRRTT